ncbi:MAG: hypothetical protein ACREPQ_00590 [Rhodanobacter sp.]
MFLYGPGDTVPAAWLGYDGLIFQIEAGKRPELAKEAVLPFADRMGEGMYRQLQDLDEGMALAAARGEDAEPTFDARWRVVEALMDAAPWMLHPDHGLVRKDDHAVQGMHP